MTLNDKLKNLDKVYSATIVFIDGLVEKYGDVELDQLPLNIQRELIMIEIKFQNAVKDEV